MDEVRFVPGGTGAFIASAPTSRALLPGVGLSVSFSVTADGTPPFSYQWRLKDVDLPGATNPVLQIRNVQTTDAGQYRVVVGNDYGPTVSAAATLGVSQMAVFPDSYSPMGWTNLNTLVLKTDGRWAGSVGMQEPLSQVSNLVAVAAGNRLLGLGGEGPPFLTTPMVRRTAKTGSASCFYAQATGRWPLSYQWQHQGVDIPGATRPWLVLTNVQYADAGEYGVVISNSAGVLNHSPVSTLEVLAPPIITVQPQDQTAAVAAAARFSVDVRGSAPFTYQWRHNDVNIPEGTNDSLILPSVHAADAGEYRVVVSNAFGSVTSSPPAQLTVWVPPTIEAPPRSVAVALGASTAFSVKAAGTAPFIYQWRHDGFDIASATNDTLNFSSVRFADVGDYTVVVRNPGGSITSAPPASLTVLGTPAFVSIPTSQTVMAGATATFYVTAAGSPPLAYRWRFNGADLPGETRPSMTLSAVQPTSSGAYSVVVSNAAGAITSAPPATLTVITIAAAQSSASIYHSPGKFTVSCSFEHALDRTLFFLVWQPTLPSGWTLRSVSGDGNPQISGDQIVFGNSLPNPVRFTYVAAVPDGQTGRNRIYGGALCFMSGMSGTEFTPADPNPLVVDRGPLVSLQQNGLSITLTLLGDAGSAYAIQTSTNLTEWVDAWETIITSGPVQTNLPLSSDRTFYRARELMR